MVRAMTRTTSVTFLALLRSFRECNCRVSKGHTVLYNVSMAHLNADKFNLLQIQTHRDKDSVFYVTLINAYEQSWNDTSSDDTLAYVNGPCVDYNWAVGYNNRRYTIRRTL